jgi:outer membrane protein TolC
VISVRIRTAGLVLALAARVPSPTAAQVSEGYAAPSDSLRLGDVLELAEDRNPMLRAFRAAATAAAAREPEASTLPDPVLQLGVMNFGLPNFNTDMPTSMAPSIRLMQMIPFPGKLGLEGEIAGYARERASASAREAGWEVRVEAASLFFGLYSLDRRIEVMRRTLALLHDFREVANAMYVAGEGRQADVLRADVEAARMDAEIQRMEAMRSAHAAELNAVLDLPAATEVAPPVLGALPAEVPASETLLAWAKESRPVIENRRLAVDQAQAQLDLARKEIWPDVMFGLAYGQRKIGMGTERMGSAMIEFSLPLHAGNRQYAMRAEASAMREMATAELGSTEASVDGSIGVQLAELDRARRLTSLFRDEVIPQARATVESAFSSYRVGSVDFMTLVDAQMTVNRYEGELFELLAEYGKAFAALESLVGRELPRTGPMLREQS